MFTRSKSEARRSLLLCLVVLGLVTAIIVLPTAFGTSAASQKGKGLVQRTVSNEDGFPNFDIREQKGDDIMNMFASYRTAAGKTASAVADTRDQFVRGEETLRATVPTLKVEYNSDIRIPEVIGPDFTVGRAFLTGATRPAGQKHADVLINFLKSNNSLIGATDQQIDALKVFADYTNPDGNLSFVELEQYINNILVFRGGVKAGFTQSGQLIRVINNLAPGVDYATVSTDFGDPAEAVRSAAPNANYELKSTDTVPNAAASSPNKVTFGGGGDWDITAEKMYFPTEPGVVVPAWRVLIWKPTNAYYVIVDAKSGTMLWRKNISDDQTQAATYNVYSNGNSFINVAESPGPITPGPINPTLGTQGAAISRTNVTLIGNEAPNPGLNNLGWMTDGTNGVNGWTDGNNVEAGLDIDGINGVDPTGKANGTNRVLSFSYNPPPGGTDGPTVPALRSGAATQLFYINNRYHDVLYSFGFTEAARNFQNDNFGRGGVAADRVSGEVQDSSGTNNANFATPADGGRGRMQMYVFTNTGTGRDGDFDGDVVIHEHTHGLSNRLVGNGSGLGTTRAGGMGEGWSDFYGLSLEADATDPINGIYSTGSYVTYNLPALSITTTNSYYGIRRFPYAAKQFTGGAGNLPHNPETAGDVNTGCSFADGAYGVSSWLAGSSCTEVHNQGEVWATILFETRWKFITRLGFNAGNARFLQIVTDAMKLSANNPNFQTMRDSILAAAAALPVAPDASADVADVWSGFATRGMGFGATDNGTVVVESFGLPNVNFQAPITVSDSTGDNDGFPEPGENILVNVTVTNPTGATVNNVTASITGGGMANYGNMAAGATTTMPITFTVPAGAVCGSLQNVSIIVASALATNPAVVQSFRLGVPVGGAPVTFTNSTLVNLPAGQPTTTSGPASPYPSSIAVSGLSGNKNIKVKLNQASHTFPADLDFLLVGPSGQMMEVMSDQGGGTDIVNADITLTDTAATAVPATIVTGEYRPTADTGQDPFVAPAPAGPYQLPAPGGAATLASVYGTDGTGMNGTWSLYAVDDAGVDSGALNGGWSLTFEANDYACSLGGTPTPTATPTNTPTGTPTNTPTATPTNTPTATPTATATATATATPTATATATPSTTPTPSCTPGQLYDNGPLVTNPTGGFGGAPLSALQTALGLNILGFGAATTTTNRMADDFVVPAGGWTINTVTLYGYQTGSTTTSTFTDARVQIWNGNPSAGGVIVYGDTTTNRFASTAFTGAYRATDTAPTGNTRPIMSVVANINTTLPAGTYWIDWQLGGTGASGPWVPPVSLLGQVNKPGSNGQQFTTVWAPATDTGTALAVQDLPFVLTGTGVCGTPTATPTATPINTGTPTATPTATPTNTPTATPTPTPCGGSPVTFAANAGTLGPIPDNNPATPLDVTFTVAGVTGPLTNVEVSNTFNPIHTWAGDVDVTLIAPDATQFVIYASTGATTATGVGDSSDLSGPYNFKDSAAGTNWWLEAANQATGAVLTPGDYRTTQAGPQAAANFSPPTNLSAAFAGVANANGTWTLRFTDNAAGDTGAVSAASLTLAGSGGCGTPTATPTATPTNTPTSTPTATPTNTPTATPTATPTSTPTATPTPQTTFIAFSSPTYTEDESQTAMIPINRTGVTTGVSTIQFTTSNGTATGGAACTSGVDYISVNQPVTFNANDTQKIVQVVICGDMLVEPVQTVNLAITGPSTFAPEAPDAGSAVLNINDTASSFRNVGSICTNLGSPADVYPSPVVVAGGPVQIGAMRVTLYDVWHQLPDNIDVLLVGPGGQKFVLMGDAGGAIPVSANAPVTLTFSDTAGAVLPDSGPLVTGQFEPTTWVPNQANFPVPAPVGPYNEPGSTVGGTGTQTLQGNYGLTNANGTWNLYLRDDDGNVTAVTGCISGGWGIEFLASTAAGVEVSGRVMTPEGIGLKNAKVVITDQQGVSRTVTTSSFGYYSIDGLRAGETYVIGVVSKRYTFAPRVLQLTDNITDMDFVAQQ